MNRIALTLSGGGVRASAFHAGVLLFLAEKNLLENIKYLSTVSGGTLFTGLLYNLTDLKWPSSAEYIKESFFKIRDLLINNSLQYDMLKKLKNIKNWKYIIHRAKILEEVLYNDWNITAYCSDISGSPIWTINGTTAETGKRFRYKNGTIGDYVLGYADIDDFKLASAIAISAAFPLLIGPLPFHTTNYVWKKKKTWNTANAEVVDLDYKKINLYDAGIYDNLGIEPFFDVGRQEMKKDIDADMLFVSDASAPFIKGSIPYIFSLNRPQRLVDIFTEQIRFLRIRSLMNFYKNTSCGLICTIGDDPYMHMQKEDICPKIKNKILNEKWLSGRDIHYAHTYKTTLHSMKPSDFDIISQHGYETAKLRFLFNQYEFNFAYPTNI